MASAQPAGQLPPGPPYPPTTALLGGRPTEIPDVPVSAVFLGLFLVAAVANLATFIKNKKRGHKFILQMGFVAFCVIRVAANALRIVWAYRPTNLSVGIAAQILVAAGTVILVIINYIFVQRIVRATHPRLGWSKPATAMFPVATVIIALTILMLIATVVQSFFTLDPYTRYIDRSILKYGVICLTVMAFLPIPIISLSLVIPRRKDAKIDHFGKGGIISKSALSVTAATLLTLGAAWRAAGVWLPQQPAMQSPWYMSKACFYIFNLATEFLVVFIWLVGRVDQRFHIPNGSKGPGSYSKLTDLGEKQTYASQITLGFADSEELLRYPDPVWSLPGSTLDFDNKSGHWKLNRVSDAISLAESKAPLEWSMLGQNTNRYSR